MTLLESLAKLDTLDFRVRGRCKFKASEIAATTICSMICGGTSYYDFAEFAREKEAWLRTFLDLAGGLPSHDAIRYFWTRLPPAKLNACFMEWVEIIRGTTVGDCVHIDGKCVRRATDDAARQPCVVSAYSSCDRIVVGQLKTQEKSNEITVFAKLIRSLNLKGAVVTIDAAGCQRKVAEAIVDKEADYLLALKGNQGTMHEEVAAAFDLAGEAGCGHMAVASVTEKGHGRITEWTCTQTDDLEWFADKAKWAGLKSACMVRTVTTEAKTGKVTENIRYFVSSLGLNPELALAVARGHWDVENPLHWTLDMVFDEDHSRARGGFAAENLAISRHFAFNAIRKAKNVSGGIKRRKMALSWNDRKMLKAILAA